MNELKEFCYFILDWWKLHQDDCVGVEDDEWQVYYDKPEFVSKAEEILEKMNNVAN